MALVANRGDNSISVLSVNGTDVKVTDTIAMPDSVAHVVFTPDGKRALAVRFPAHKVSVLDIAGDLEANPPRVIDRVVIGDGPEGLAMSPKGDLAVAVILRGSNMKNAFFHQKNGSIS